MAFILMSFLKTHIKDGFGNRVPVALDNENGISANIMRLLPRTDKLVIVANDPYDFEDNDDKLKTVSDSFEKTGVKFKSAVFLDDRNKDGAEEILVGADLIILSGGKCFCQNRFFEKIGLKKLLKDQTGLTVGVSSGAMNLCKTVANFPEEESDLTDPRWFDGLGFFDGIVIPHFDGQTKTYQLDCGAVDVARDHILPMSCEKDFIGLSNSSYIVIENDGKIGYYGDIYKISKGCVTKLQAA